MCRQHESVSLRAQLDVGPEAGERGAAARRKRRLEAEELRFDALLDEVRRDLAASYLSQTSRQISTIASMLGYASPSSFSRWFAGVFGKAPHAWREEKRKERDRSVAGAAGRRSGSRA